MGGQTVAAAGPTITRRTRQHHRRKVAAMLHPPMPCTLTMKVRTPMRRTPRLHLPPLQMARTSTTGGQATTPRTRRRRQLPCTQTHPQPLITTVMKNLKFSSQRRLNQVRSNSTAPPPIKLALANFTASRGTWCTTSSSSSSTRMLAPYLHKSFGASLSAAAGNPWCRSAFGTPPCCLCNSSHRRRMPPCTKPGQSCKPPTALTRYSRCRCMHLGSSGGLVAR